MVGQGKAMAGKVVARRGIQVIARAANVLRALEDEPDGLSLGDIAKKVGLARSTVQRIVGALADEQFLIAATPKARVKLGPALIRLASSANIDIAQLLKPFIKDLSRSLQETVDLSILKGEVAVFIDQVQGNHRLQAVSHIGDAFPLHCTANGKALLATLPRQSLEKHLKKERKAYTPHTITGTAGLLAEIQEYEKTLIAVDREEHTEGICAVGTSFTDSLGRVFAISIPVPASRFKRIEPTLRKELFDCRAAIVAKLGNDSESMAC